MNAMSVASHQCHCSYLNIVPPVRSMTTGSTVCNYSMTHVCVLLIAAHIHTHHSESICAFVCAHRHVTLPKAPHFCTGNLHDSYGHADVQIPKYSASIIYTALSSPPPAASHTTTWACQYVVEVFSNKSMGLSSNISH